MLISLRKCLKNLLLLFKLDLYDFFYEDIFFLIPLATMHQLDMIVYQSSNK